MPDPARMIDSTELLRDGEGLRDRMESDGYLFFPRLVDADRATAVKRDIMAILRERFIIEEDGVPDPMWSGGPQPTEAEYMAVYDRIVRLESFRGLARSPEVLALL